MLPEKYKAISDEQAILKIRHLKALLGKDVFILGHHYQRDEVIQFADATGDSLGLSQEAAKINSKYIVFCGVKFMAETADIVTADNQKVILPDLAAGCPMADMANEYQIQKAWDEIAQVVADISNVVPVTYVNSAATVKAFCGENGGLTCTSSNAGKVLDWAFNQGKQVFFFPDRYLGTNTAMRLGLKDKEIVLWNREEDFGGLSPEKIKTAKIITWDGYCPVHKRFESANLDLLREKYPDLRVIVHPEVPESLAIQADEIGSTSYIIKVVSEAPDGSIFAVGTEAHLVSRLAKEYPNKRILSLNVPTCMCATMERISPQNLLWILESLAEGKVENQIIVPKNIKEKALIAINSMFELS
ncbi:quinolinate synthase NadA [Patescibacteria group bacterium]|nr:quinolinate synthase NadA [Patescibacteria group bacterium]